MSELREIFKNVSIYTIAAVILFVIAVFGPIIGMDLGMNIYTAGLITVACMAVAFYALPADARELFNNLMSFSELFNGTDRRKDRGAATSPLALLIIAFLFFVLAALATLVLIYGVDVVMSRINEIVTVIIVTALALVATVKALVNRKKSAETPESNTDMELYPGVVDCRNLETGAPAVSIRSALWQGKTKTIDKKPVGSNIVEVYLDGSWQATKVFDVVTNTMYAIVPHPSVTPEMSLKSKVIDAFVEYIKIKGNVDWKGVSIGPGVTGAQYEADDPSKFSIKAWVLNWGASQGIQGEELILQSFIGEVAKIKAEKAIEEAARAADEQAARDRQYAETMERLKHG